MENIRSLKQGEKYTLCAFNSNGMPYYVPFVLKRFRCDSHAGNSEAYMLGVKTMRGKEYAIWLYHRKQFIIWPGYVRPNTDEAVSFHIKDSASGPVKMMRRYQAYDTRYMDRALKSVEIVPQVKHILPVQASQVELFNFPVAV